MLPFVRILEYGNIKPVYEPNIVKMVAPSAFLNNTLMLLDKNGYLWGIGGNNSGIFGLGNTTSQNTWVRIMTNVKNFWCCGNSAYNLVQTNDNRFFYAGTNLWTGASSNTTSTSFVECTSYFEPIGADNIKEIYTNLRSVMLLTNSGVLYAIGDNGNYELGLVGMNLITSFTQTNTNVKKYCSYYNSPSWIIKDDNTAWRCGSTSNGTLLTGVAQTFLQAWTQYNPGAGQTCADIAGCNGYLGIFMNTGSSPYPLYGIGSQGAGQLGNNNTSNTNKLTLAPPSISIALEDISDFEFFKSYSANTRGIVYRSGNSLFGAGYNGYGQLGNNTTNNASGFVQVQMPSTMKFDSKTSLVAANDNSLFVFANNILYYTGMTPIGTFIGTKVLTEYPLPQI